MIRTSLIAAQMSDHESESQAKEQRYYEALAVCTGTSAWAV